MREAFYAPNSTSSLIGAVRPLKDVDYPHTILDYTDWL